MVDVIHRGLAVYETDKVFDDLDEVFLGEHAEILVGAEAKFAVEAETSHVAEVVALFAEEELVDDVAGGVLIRRFRIAELLVDVVHSLDLRVGRIFLESVENDGVLAGACFILLEENALDVGVEDSVDGFIVKDGIPFHDGERTLDGDDFAGIFILEVLCPGLEHLGSELAAFVGLQSLLVYRNFVGKVEDIDDIFVGVESDGPEQGCYGKFLLAVDVGEHHIVDVAGKLYPGSLDGDDSGGVEFRAVGVLGLVEEHAGGTVELRYDDALGTVDYECAARCHVRDVAKVNVLDLGIEILMFRVGARKAEFCLQRNTVGQSSLKTFLDRILRRVHEIVDELQLVAVPHILDGEYFLEDLIQTFVLPAFRSGLKLEKILEGLQLDLKQIRVFQYFGACEINSLRLGLF